MKRHEENKKDPDRKISETGETVTEVSKTEISKTEEKQKKEPVSPSWSQDAQDELQDFIEQQGVYLRQ